VVTALAGRRIDKTDADPPRFPAENVSLVATRIEAAFKEHNAGMLVSSAACGADLIALEIAGKLKLRRRVILPFSVQEFKQSSVIDRPGDWGRIYDRVISEAEIVILGFGRHDPEAYRATNVAILEDALSHGPAAAFVVWDQKSRGVTDLTEQFRAEARTRQLPVVDISTLGQPDCDSI
jgi:hypothetical protein